jgi:antitoxin CcdA
MPKAAAVTATPRHPTNVNLSEPLLTEASTLRINLSQDCERGLAIAVAEAKAQQWLAENRPEIEAWNDYVERHGLPLAEFRQF